jgi:hypothetical protein
LLRFFIIYHYYYYYYYYYYYCYYCWNYYCYYWLLLSFSHSLFTSTIISISYYYSCTITDYFYYYQTYSVFFLNNYRIEVAREFSGLICDLLIRSPHPRGGTPRQWPTCSFVLDLFWSKLLSYCLEHLYAADIMLFDFCLDKYMIQSTNILPAFLDYQRNLQN